MSKQPPKVFLDVEDVMKLHNKSKRWAYERLKEPYITAWNLISRLPFTSFASTKVSRKRNYLNRSRPENLFRHRQSLLSTNKNGI